MDHRLEILHAHSSVTTRALSFHLVSFRERKRVIYISGGIGKGEESSEERSEREREGERETRTRDRPRGRLDESASGACC